MSDLPLTSTRLAACLSIVAVHQAGDSALPFDLSNLDQLKNMISNPVSSFNTATLSAAADLALNAAEYASSWKTIGAVMGLTINQTATPIARGGINSPIESWAMLPGKITTTLDIVKTMLYYEDALSAFNFMPGNIALQTTPLIIIENLAVPDSPEIQKRFGSFARTLGTAVGLGINNIGALQPNIYVGCRISSSRTTYDMQGNDQMVVQNITMDVARIVNPMSEVVTQASRAIGSIFGPAAANAVTGGSTVLASNVSIVNKIAK